MKAKLFATAIACLSFLVLLAPALAAESPSSQVTINGRILTDVGWWSRSGELTSSGEDVGTSFVQIPDHSFLRARWRSADATSGAMVELGLAGNGRVAKGDDVHLRHAYGWYRYGRCRLLAGKTDSWFGSLLYHPRQYLGAGNNDHLLMWGWGFLWGGRRPQLQFALIEETWGLQLAVEEPVYNRSRFGGADEDAFNTFPRASLTMMLKAPGIVSHPGISYTHHEMAGGLAGADDYFDTFAAVWPLQWTTGAFTLKLQGHYGWNFAAEFEYYPLLALPAVSADGLRLQRTYVTGGMVAGEYRLGNLLITGGVGFELFENDSWADRGWAKDRAERKAYFVALPYQVNKYFGIHPEFNYFDYHVNPVTGKEAGAEWMLGMQFRFIF